MLLLHVLIISLIQHSLQEKPYTFEPESRHIEINDGENYLISFNQIDDKTEWDHCFIQSDTINADYPIVKQNETVEGFPSIPYEVFRDPPRFSPYNNTLVCGFVYYSVDNTGPAKWTITAHDKISNQNYTEEVTVSFYYNMALYLDRFVALPTASVANFFQAGSTKLKKCSIGFDNSTLELDLNAIKKYSDDNVFKNRLYSLGEGRCGYKINNLATGDPSDITLYATDDNNKVYRNTAHLVVTKDEELKNRTIEVYLGDNIRVICGRETDTATDSNQQFCHFFNPQGVLVSHDPMCAYELDIVTKEDLGTWKCSVGYKYTMEALEFTTELVEKKLESVETFTENGTDYFILGCKLVDYEVNSLHFCKFTRPDGKVFKVTTGGATADYNTFTTDLQGGKCGLEITKPLKDEDKGSWKCEAAISENESSGAFISVETTTTFPYTKNSMKNVNLGGTFVVDCMVPFASDYCYIMAPNGTQYKPDDRLQVTSGGCRFKVEEATASDNGTWRCAIAQKNGIPDEIVTVEIAIIELKVIYGDVEAAIDEDADLICNTNGIPIEYCRFESPNGLSYSLRKEDSATSTKISYVGRGLEYGDCGLKILKTDESYAGSWRCHISPGRYNYVNKKDLTQKIELSVNPKSSPITTAQSIGIAVGVVAAVVIVGGLFFYRYSRRVFRNRGNVQESTNTPRVSDDSNRSGEHVVLSVTQSTYNTN